MAHEWTEEQRRKAEVQIFNRFDYFNSEEVIDLQCEINEARELLKKAHPFVECETDCGCKGGVLSVEIRAWLDRNAEEDK